MKATLHILSAGMEYVTVVTTADRLVAYYNPKTSDPLAQEAFFIGSLATSTFADIEHALQARWPNIATLDPAARLNVYEHTDEVVSLALTGVPLRPDAHYHTPLPVEVAPFYCYPLDSGHSILAVPSGLEPRVEHLVPVPVATMLRLGWFMQDGLPVVDLPYDPELGLVVEPADEEW